ncbi:MAG: hypothetical protein U9Q30_05865 [Campylobacterota bacterium]|nr:hypothetical protein [Campylobacterota bacterium]
MLLIHTALLCEAQIFIEKLKLKKTNSTPKIYSDDKYIVLISGVGEENTKKSLEYIFKNYTILEAMNIGIAGSSDKDIKIGTLFCTNQKLDNINYLPITTVDKPIISNKDFNTKDNMLYDMEAKYFLEISFKYLDNKNIFVFKAVSDYLNGMSLSKDEIKNMISNNYKKVINIWQK